MQTKKIMKIVAVAAVVLLLSMAMVGGVSAITVTYNANGGSGDVPVDSTEYTAGDTVSVLGNTGGLTKTNYVFSGWNTQSGGDGTQYTPYSVLTTGNSNITLYAQWGTQRTVSITTSDPLSTGGSVSFEYSVNSGTWTPYSTTFNVNKSDSVTIRAACTDCVIRPQDWNVSGGTVTADGYNTVTFTVGDECVYVLAEKGKLLPAGYTELEYLQSDGAAYIDTGEYVDSENPRVRVGVLDCDDDPITGIEEKDRHIYFGVRAHCVGTGLWYTVDSFTKDSLRMYYNNYYSTTGYLHPEGYDRNEYHDYELYYGVTNGYAKLDDEFLHTGKGGYPSASITEPPTLYLFGAHNVGSQGDIFFNGGDCTRIYYYEHYDSSDALISNYIPCIRSDGVLGMYNVCATSDGFKQNNNTTGTFTGGYFPVTYYANGATSGSAPVDGTAYENGDTVTVLGNTGNLWLSGKAFVGWTCEQDLETTSGPIVAGNLIPVGTVFTMPVNNVVLKAKWDTPDTTVTLDNNGGDTDPYPLYAYEKRTYYVNGVPFTTAAARTGYTLDGWYTESSGGSKILNADGSADGTAVAGWVDSNGKWVKTDAAATLYAKWTPITYTVHYDANGGTGTMTDQEFMYDVAQNLSTNEFTNSGYTFAGWATSAEGEVVYTDGQSVSNLASTQGATVTLYAKWVVNDPTFTFEIPATVNLSKNLNGMVSYPISIQISNPGDKQNFTVVLNTESSGVTESGYDKFTVENGGYNAYYLIEKKADVDSDYIAVKGKDSSATVGTNELLTLTNVTGAASQSGTIRFKTIELPQVTGTYSGQINFKVNFS